jgi:molybdopterin molybdotransferase
MDSVPTLTFREARERVISEVRGSPPRPAVEAARLEDAAGRVLAEDVTADRDLPALARSVRDGYAVRAADLPGTLAVIGEVRAGWQFSGAVGAGQAVEIMTGAPVPAGADAVVMVESARREGARVVVEETAAPGQFISPQGCEAKAGEPVLRAGTLIDYSGVAAAASVGCERLWVFHKPTVAILTTGDELVEVTQQPAPYQVRDSNACSLAAQVARAGGAPRILPAARDEEEDTRKLVERGLECDLLLLSGGVSAGKYDVVERALATLGARFIFDRVLVQPGQPLVFGRAAGKFFFGLPGNPASTMVTFELFARAAVELLAGRTGTPLPMPLAKLTSDFRHRPGLTRFLPARLSADGETVTPVEWSGSGDVPAVARANVYLVAEPDHPLYVRGELIKVLFK